MLQAEGAGDAAASLLDASLMQLYLRQLFPRHAAIIRWVKAGPAAASGRRELSDLRRVARTLPLTFRPLCSYYAADKRPRLPSSRILHSSKA